MKHINIDDSNVSVAKLCERKYKIIIIKMEPLMLIFCFPHHHRKCRLSRLAINHSEDTLIQISLRIIVLLISSKLILWKRNDPYNNTISFLSFFSHFLNSFIFIFSLISKYTFSSDI